MAVPTITRFTTRMARVPGITVRCCCNTAVEVLPPPLLILIEEEGREGKVGISDNEPPRGTGPYGTSVVVLTTLRLFFGNSFHNPTVSLILSKVVVLPSAVAISSMDEVYSLELLKVLPTVLNGDVVVTTFRGRTNDKVDS